MGQSYSYYAGVGFDSDQVLVLFSLFELFCSTLNEFCWNHSFRYSFCLIFTFVEWFNLSSNYYIYLLKATGAYIFRPNGTSFPIQSKKVDNFPLKLSIWCITSNLMIKDIADSTYSSSGTTLWWSPSKN